MHLYRSNINLKIDIPYSLLLYDFLMRYYNTIRIHNLDTPCLLTYKNNCEMELYVPGDKHNFCTGAFWWNINCTIALTARALRQLYCNAIRKSVASPIVHQIASIRLAECKHVITLKSH